MIEKDACGVGFIADIKGIKSHKILSYALEGLANLDHRGAVSADGKTGDGAGILTHIPYKFFIKECEKLRIELPDKEDLAVGMFFLPLNKVDTIQKEIEDIINQKFKFLGWRKVPINEEEIGEIASRTKPAIYQAFISKKGLNIDNFERELFILRKKLEKLTKNPEYKDFYIPSLSSKTIVYKGLITAPKLKYFYYDLQDENFETAIAIFHQRYSTNTFPNWKLAHPFRMLAHNGEINTITANRNWLRAKEEDIRAIWGDLAEDILPIVKDEDSDSASLDNAIEFLYHSGKDILTAINALVPRAWENDDRLSAEEKAFYEYFACIFESWDGPAAIAFTDGEIIGGKLDRNGLRPARYIITDDIIYMASEVGIIDLPEEEIKIKGRLGPGDKIALDTKTGKIYFSQEIIRNLVKDKKYKEWVEQNIVEFIPAKDYPQVEYKNILQEAIVFGYDKDEINMVVKEMALKGTEPVYSMGNDTPISVLSKKPKMLASYFKQRFAQVTNPPIDPIREKKVMSLKTYVGKKENFLTETPEHAKQLVFSSPIIFDNEMEELIKRFENKVEIIPTIFEPYEAALEPALENIAKRAEEAVDNGKEIIILTDRDISIEGAPIPMGLAVAAVNSYLSSKGKRSKCSIVADSGEVRDTHSIAFLIGYGATLVNPYMAVQIIKNLTVEDKKFELSFEEAVSNYKKAVNEGLLKIMSKMGIATIKSYRGSGLFEALGISKEIIDKYFKGTPSKIGGIGLKEIAAETLARFNMAFSGELKDLPQGGEYRHRREGGEFHSWNPKALTSLHKAVRNNIFDEYKAFTQYAYAEKPVELRDLLEIVSDRPPIPIEEVEPIESIMKRFVGAGMSIGALSREAHETIAEALNRVGAKSNSGEGGEDPARYGTIKNSKIKQVASGRFGVTPEYLNSAEEIEIKIAQGAKPGEGGQLPGKKVDAYIAFLRHAKPGITLISPPPHHDIYSIEDLAQLIYDLKMINPKAKVIVKLVAETGIGVVASGVAKAFADIIHISGHDGGTGASPLVSIKNAGSIWELGLSEVQQALIENDLRNRVKLRVDGGIKTGRDIIIGALLGAEEFGLGTALMIAEGCVMARQCHLNTCPVGITTQDKRLREKFPGTPEHIIKYLEFLATEVRQYLADMGYKSLDEIIGKTELLKPNIPQNHYKAKYIDVSEILKTAKLTEKPRKSIYEFNEIPPSKQPFDLEILKDVLPYIEKDENYAGFYVVKNTYRSIGTRIAHEIVKRYGDKGLRRGKIELNLRGTAGQSFGAFCVKGLTLSLTGQANDYVGKGMAGGTIIIKPPKEFKGKSHEHVIAGNTILYGATGGQVFISGIVGERFAVRNSGAVAVAEGAGDHLCEYMTAGTVLILGKTGINIGAGMTGGTLYIYDPMEEVKDKINTSYVKIAELEEEDIKEIRDLIIKHLGYTDSQIAKEIIDNFEEEINNFVKVVPPVVEKAAQETDELEVRK
ncbi:glutamate synthase large subunit [Venenivibrio stagnispumantis]|uniref:Glutamate synthase [NADPH] large chain n=1 Tax=Venenivibrio stagnispumantis TaxID=407998 RepID=A0AA46AE03_9AQUI|nr:glutamate synthase large subunit [Venenivibrio stagnispumantis]MCW4573846.1 glutamate synthase large subunit [Venenivibrio stagnispumantis]SMP10092.1 glutamate synthase (NADPH/NADH) large chain [Venenivibrio stagnispumantis]